MNSPQYPALRQSRLAFQSTLKRLLFSGLLISSTAALVPTAVHAAPFQMENLGRGVVAMRTGTNSVYIGWRLLGLDPSGIGFNVYRGATKVNSTVITGSTNLVDTGANLAVANTYTVRPVINGVEQAASAGFTLPANAATQQYLRVALQRPAGGTTPTGEAYTYSPNDVSAADLDGDGEYDLVVKWDPSNSKDNSQSGYTGNVFLDGYKLDGTRLWRIDLGRNIRAGAHYTQFMVYDLDGDGKAEVACKTAPGTVSGTGQNVLLSGDSATADYRNTSGYILSGPEYFTIFNGQTGAALATINYNPGRGTVGDWGDTYGNRVDRFLAGIAYLDGTRPSVVMARGYYTRAAIVAYDWRNGQLTQRWIFDTGNSTTGSLAGYRGQGAHSLSVADVDNDGRHEIIYGAAAINDDGTGLHITGLGHGDALHVSDMNPNRAGLEIFMPHEDPAGNGNRGATVRDGSAGTVLWSTSATTDVGRGAAGDIDSRYAGYEVWATNSTSLYSITGTAIGQRPSQTNFLVWWDADLKRELLDGTTISKWNETAATASALLSPTGIGSNNSTKATPNLSADLFGDWREEVVWRETSNDALRIYTTTDVATNRFYTLMHDAQYRVAIAWQNVAYNQPPHPSFYLGSGMGAQPAANITYAAGGGGGGGGADTYQAENATAAGGVTIDSNNAGFNGTGFANFPTTGGTLTFNNVDGNGGGSKSLVIRYANGSGVTRTGTISVNGGTATNITFPTTANFTTWATLTVTITLNNNATNTIRFASTGSDLANLDEITVP